ISNIIESVLLSLISCKSNGAENDETIDKGSADTEQDKETMSDEAFINKELFDELIHKSFIDEESINEKQTDIKPKKL
ncbi:18892_t:CDS:1, partial [Racocetra persica]